MKTTTKLIVLLLTIVASWSFTSSEKQEKTITIGSTKSIYQTSEGKLSGHYQSFYANGNIKAEGYFENNCRIGKWIIWDSVGNKLAIREYSSPLEVTVIKLRGKAEIQSSFYTLKRNESGFYDFFNLSESMVIQASALLRFIPITDNAILVKYKIFELLNNGIIKKQIDFYSDNQLQRKLTKVPNTANKKLIGYKIREDYVIDNQRKISEIRVLSICPVVVNAANDTLDLYWIFYPECRAILATQKVIEEGYPSYFNNLDDFFFFPALAGNYYWNESIVSPPKYPSNSIADRISISEKIEIQLIEDEHDLWLSWYN